MKEIERILDLEAVESYGIDGSIEGINIFRSKALVICAEGIIYLGKERIREEEFISSAAGAGTKLFAIVYQEDENKHYLIEKYVDNGEEKITDLGEDVIENLVAFGDRLFAKKGNKVMEFRGFGVHIFKEIRRPFYSMAGCGGYLILHTGADSTKAMTQADGVMVIDLASKRTRELDHGFNCIDGVTGNSRYMLAYSGDVVIPFFKSKRLRTIDLEDKLESKSRIDFMAADDEHLFVASDEIIFKFAIKEYGKVPLDQIK